MTEGHKRLRPVLIGAAVALWLTMAVDAAIEIATDAHWPAAAGRLLLGATLAVTSRARQRPAMTPAPEPVRQDDLSDRAFWIARRLEQEYHQGGRAKLIMYRRSA